VTVALLYAMLTGAAYYLAARAQITRAIWRRYPNWLDKFMACAACSGFWYGVIAALTVGRHFSFEFLGIDAASPAMPVVVGLCSIIWTPVVAWLHLSAIERLVVDDSIASEPVLVADKSGGENGGT
jgi:hypothetical protein